MGNYRFIPEEQKKLVITMLDRGQTPANIENATGISARTVQCVRRLWLSTGRVIKQPLEEGRRRILTSLEVNVSDHFLTSGICRKFPKLFLNCSYSFLRALLSSGRTYTSKSCNMPSLLCMMLKCQMTLFIEPYETVALRGKR